MNHLPMKHQKLLRNSDKKSYGEPLIAGGYPILFICGRGIHR